MGGEMTPAEAATTAQEREGGPDSSGAAVERFLARWRQLGRGDHLLAIESHGGVTFHLTGHHLDRLVTAAKTPDPAHDAKGRGPEYDRGFADGRNAQRAESAPEIVDVFDVPELPKFSIVVGCSANNPEPRGGPQVVGEPDNMWTWPEYRVLYRAPVPPVPLAVGDTVETEKQLDSLPVGAVARTPIMRGGRVVEKRGFWYAAGDECPISVDALIGARILDLPEGSDGASS